MLRYKDSICRSINILCSYKPCFRFLWLPLTGHNRIHKYPNILFLVTVLNSCCTTLFLRYLVTIYSMYLLYKCILFFLLQTLFISKTTGLYFLSTSCEHWKQNSNSLSQIDFYYLNCIFFSVAYYQSISWPFWNFHHIYCKKTFFFLLERKVSEEGCLPSMNCATSWTSICSLYTWWAKLKSV